MSEKQEKEPTCQLAVPESIMERVRHICKEKYKQKTGKKLKIQDAAVEAFTAWCDDMEKELIKGE